MLKRLFVICFVISLAFSIPARAQDDTTRVLFIGNSHTYTNNVPLLFANLAASGGHTAVTAMSAPGGYTLFQHTTYQPTLNLISQGGWDYVSLQEQSIYPVIEYYRWGSFYPSATYLDSLIRGVNAQTILYMTWGRPGGGQWSIGGHYTIDFVDFFHMQDSTSASFYYLGDMLDVPVIPAGDAWSVAMTWDTTLYLWGSDNLHANMMGSYLAACVFYAVIFDSSPVGLSYISNLTPDMALFLQRAADQTVTGISDGHVEIPEEIELFECYPNPFNAGTTLEFNLRNEGPAKITVYDIAGRIVRHLDIASSIPGRHKVIWDGKDDNGKEIASGIYFSDLVQGTARSTVKMVLLQ